MTTDVRLVGDVSVAKGDIYTRFYVSCPLSTTCPNFEWFYGQLNVWIFWIFQSNDEISSNKFKHEQAIKKKHEAAFLP